MRKSFLCPLCIEQTKYYKYFHYHKVNRNNSAVMVYLAHQKYKFYYQVYFIAIIKNIKSSVRRNLCTWRVKIITKLSRWKHVCVFEWISIRALAQSRKSSIKWVNASLVSQVPSGFPRDTRGRLRFAQHIRTYTFIVELRNGLFRNNAVVCKYSWKQCGHDLTFWDSSGSVSFFVYRRMYRSRKPRYLMQKRRCIPRGWIPDAATCSRCYASCRDRIHARVSLFITIFPRIITAQIEKSRIAKKFRLNVLMKPNNKHVVYLHL